MCPQLQFSNQPFKWLSRMLKVLMTIAIPFTSNITFAQGIAASACDYSKANQYNGWGWNPVLLESCPPTSDPNSALPICSAAYFDEDGDGYGWENGASCIITAASAAPPVITNIETGNKVELVRPYWDGNTDIANRVIQCDLYYTDLNINRYVKETSPYTTAEIVHPGYQFLHQPLEPNSPFNGWIAQAHSLDGAGGRNLEYFPNLPNWTVDDGRYVGPTMLQSPYIELVTRSSGAKAIRHWIAAGADTGLALQFVNNQVNRDGYYECWDTSGRDLEPTGQSGVSTSSPAIVSDLVFSVASGPSQQAAETIVNFETGVPVMLEKAYWDYNKDLALKNAFCTPYFYFEEDQGISGYFDLAVPHEYDFPYHFTNTGSRLHYRESFLNFEHGSFVVSNGQLFNSNGATMDYEAIFGSAYVEKISGGVRFWTTSGGYSECTGITPTGSAPVVADNNQCDYSNAAQYNGWGWNSVTNQSCPPIDLPMDTLPGGGCDYSNADAHGGWGWDDLTLQSCPPVDTTPAALSQNCDYTDASQHNGWGWDRISMTSCAPQP